MANRCDSSLEDLKYFLERIEMWELELTLAAISQLSLALKTHKLKG